MRDEVLLDREQERLVLGELDEPALGRGIEFPVQRDFDDEARRAPCLRERGHPEEDPAGVLVLRDRLERFDVVQPERAHECQTPPAGAEIRRVSGSST